MPEQLLFPGFEAARQPTDRLFFAILPDRATAVRIAQLAQHLRAEHGLKGRPLLTNRLHVTLHPPAITQACRRTSSYWRARLRQRFQCGHSRSGSIAR